jgi:hypothetical protein
MLPVLLARPAAGRPVLRSDCRTVGVGSDSAGASGGVARHKASCMVREAALLLW